MTIEGAVLARLQGFAGLTALIGMRARHIVLHQDETLPAVTFQLVGTARDRLWSADHVVRLDTLQVDAWGATDDEAADVQDQVLAALDRWTGTGGGTTVDVIFVGDVLFEEYDDESKTYRVMREYDVWHRG